MILSPHIRSYEKYSAVPPDRMGKVREDVTVACLLNPATVRALDDECNLTVLGESTWERQLTDQKPTFLLTEPQQNISEESYRKITALCKAQGIPSVFWDTGEPDAVEQYGAQLCDYIFAANADNLPLYEQKNFRKKVFFLPRGIQLRTDGPVNTTHFGRRDLMTKREELYSLRENIRNHTYTRRLETML